MQFQCSLICTLFLCGKCWNCYSHQFGTHVRRYLLSKKLYVTLLSLVNQSIKHLQPSPPFGPSNHRSHPKLKGPLVLPAPQHPSVIQSKPILEFQGLKALTVATEDRVLSQWHRAACEPREYQFDHQSTHKFQSNPDNIPKTPRDNRKKKKKTQVEYPTLTPHTRLIQYLCSQPLPTLSGYSTWKKKRRVKLL